jgi:CubicO group peptidase (beta-lactamase class C family)
MSKVRQQSWRLVAVFAAFASLIQYAMAEEITRDFPAATPESVGIDSKPLIELSKYIRDKKLDVYSFLVIKDGKLIFERYGNKLTRNANYESYSMTKVVAALIAGKLNDEHKLTLQTKIAPILAKFRPDLSKYFTDPNDKRLIEFGHLMNNSAGLAYDDPATGDKIYYDAPDYMALASTAHSVVVPGKEFDYNDINPIYVAGVIEYLANNKLENMAADDIFKPMSMENAVWARANTKGLVSTGWGIRMRAMDYAKIGQLMLQGGNWNGKQLFKGNWVNEMIVPGPTDKDFSNGSWWLGDVVKSEQEYSSDGFKGQFITVLPNSKAIIVMTGTMNIDGGLRDAVYRLQYINMVNDYVMKALHPRQPAKASTEATAALNAEIKAAFESQGTPGTTVDPTDVPQGN